jgi:2-aminoethylphosphonate aminotransferase
MKKIKKNILFNPGPVTTSLLVKKALIVPDICPRESEFGKIIKKICFNLTSFVASNKKYTTILFSGSGTSAIESIITSVIPEKKNILIINNGAYGKRIVDIAKKYNILFQEFKSSSIEEINYKLLEKKIKQSMNIDYIAIVHNETSTGLLNNLDKVKNLAQKYKKNLIVDAMSSFGAIPLNMKKYRIAFLAASSNKNIEGMPGISFVVADNNSLKKISKIKSKTYYLDLYEQYSFFKKNNQMRFTPPVQVIYALKKAIDLLKKEGVAKRYKRYCKMWIALTGGLKKIGQKYLIPDKFHSKIITSIILDPRIDFNKMHDYFYKKKITIYPAKVDNLSSFRIANIGQITISDIKYFLELFKKYLKIQKVL